MFGVGYLFKINGMTPENKRIIILGSVFILSLLVITGDLNETIKLFSERGC